MRHTLIIMVFFLRAMCLAVWYSVPARLGKGQGAKEIGHNLARERPKFGHNLVHKRHKIFYAWTTKIWSCGQLMKTWAQICKHFTSCLKTQKQQLHFVKIKKLLILFLNWIFLFLNYFSIRAGRVSIGQGDSQYGQGTAPSEIGLAGTLW